MKRAIVTGGAGLIGQAICQRLLAEGWEVASFDLQPSRYGLSIHCDLADETSVEAGFTRLGWDQLDLVVNNGGWIATAPMQLGSLSLDDWQRMLGSHLTGAFLMSRAALPRLTIGSSIIMLASTRALMSEGGDFAYAAAKGGLISLAQALAVQLGPKIRVNTIAPGWISDDNTLSAADHRQHPAGRVGRPSDVADAVMYLQQAEFMTGQLLTLDGGMTRKMIYQD